MWLINTTTYEIKAFVEPSDGGVGEDLPFYAILSHTWAEDEVTFQDIQNNDFLLKKGFQKLKGFCKTARCNGFAWAWMDTCCIDKRSSAELSEAINSMFDWYKNSMVCYVYLEDYRGCDAEYERCRWFTRGWTLQELIAPRMVVFFDRDWKDFGNKWDLAARISHITWIDQALLRLQADLPDYSVAEKMRWAARRRTTRAEDRSYSLLGLFNVHMPLLYGEGHSAFYRLQEEIIKSTNDLSIFVWQKPWGITGSNTSWGLFAPSPTFFESAEGVIPTKMARKENTATIGERPFNITNTGLQIQLRCTVTDSEVTGPGIHPQTSFLKADLECCHRRYQKQAYFMILDFENNVHVKTLFATAKWKDPIHSYTTRCRRVSLLHQNGQVSPEVLSCDASLLLSLMIFPLRGMQTPKSVIPQTMKFDSMVEFDRGILSYRLIHHEGGDYGRGILALQGFKKFSTNACFSVFGDVEGNGFSLKVMAETMPNIQPFTNVLCFFKAEIVHDPLSWKLRVHDGRPLPAQFKLQSGQVVSVRGRYSVGNGGVRQLKLNISVQEPDPNDVADLDQPSENQQAAHSWFQRIARDHAGQGVPIYGGQSFDLVTKTPLELPKKGDYFQQ
jgi:hypothetical protein